MEPESVKISYDLLTSISVCFKRVEISFLGLRTMLNQLGFKNLLYVFEFNFLTTQNIL